MLQLIGEELAFNTDSLGSTQRLKQDAMSHVRLLNLYLPPACWWRSHRALQQAQRGRSILLTLEMEAHMFFLEQSRTFEVQFLNAIDFISLGRSWGMSRCPAATR
jgi:hypothetical protein